MMRTLLIASSLALLFSGCSDGSSPLAPGSPDFVRHTGAQPERPSGERIPASGSFEALVDFSTLTLVPRGRNCLLEVDGQLVFTGTLEGTATGTTRALVFAPCTEVQANPPGTFPDVFRSELEFDGEVNGVAGHASMVYMGRSHPGGAIDAHLLLSKGLTGVLTVEAQLAVGGSYEGSVSAP